MTYVCPGCKAHDMAYECWHDEGMWKLAEALSVGLIGGPASWGDPIERAWQFIDDAEGLVGSVGAPPYSVSMFHVGGMPAATTTIGLVNGRYLFIVDEEAQLIGDVFDGQGRAQLVMPDLTPDVVAEGPEWEYGVRADEGTSISYRIFEQSVADALGVKGTKVMRTKGIPAGPWVPVKPVTESLLETQA